MPDPNDLCTVQDVKDVLSITTSVDDDKIQKLVTGASLIFRSTANLLGILLDTYSVVRSGKGRVSMPLPHTPIRSISSLTVSGVEIPPSSDGVRPGYVFDDFMVHLIGYVFAAGFGNVRITYQAGYETIPADIALGVAELAATKLRRNKHIETESETLNNQTIVFRKSDIPPEVMKTINNYKNRGLIE